MEFEILFREQGGYHEHGEYTYNGWRNIDIVLKFIIQPGSDTNFVTPQIRDVTGQRQTYTYASEALTY